MNADDLYRGYILLEDLKESIPSADPVALTGVICHECGSHIGPTERSKAGVTHPNPARANDWERVCGNDLCQAPWKGGLRAVVWRGEFGWASKRSTMEDQSAEILEHLRRVKPMIEEQPEDGTSEDRWATELFAWGVAIHAVTGGSDDDCVTVFRARYGGEHPMSFIRAFKRAVRHARGVVEERLHHRGERWRLPDETRRFLTRLST